MFSGDECEAEARRIVGRAVLRLQQQDSKGSGEGGTSGSCTGQQPVRTSVRTVAAQLNATADPAGPSRPDQPSVAPQGRLRPDAATGGVDGDAELQRLRAALAEANERARAADDAAERLEDHNAGLLTLVGVLKEEKVLLLDYVQDMLVERKTVTHSQPSAQAALVASLRAEVKHLKTQLASSRKAEDAAVAAAARAEQHAVRLAAELATVRKVLDAQSAWAQGRAGGVLQHGGPQACTRARAS